LLLIYLYNYVVMFCGHVRVYNLTNRCYSQPWPSVCGVEVMAIPGWIYCFHASRILYSYLLHWACIAAQR